MLDIFKTIGNFFYSEDSLNIDDQNPSLKNSEKTKNDSLAVIESTELDTQSLESKSSYGEKIKNAVSNIYENVYMNTTAKNVVQAAAILTFAITSYYRGKLALCASATRESLALGAQLSDKFIGNNEKSELLDMVRFSLTKTLQAASEGVEILYKYADFCPEMFCKVAKYCITQGEDCAIERIGSKVEKAPEYISDALHSTKLTIASCLGLPELKPLREVSSL